MDNFESLKNLITTASSIAIITHVNPDGDTLGSSLALKLILEKHFAKDAQLVVNSNIPEIYKFLPNIETVVHNTQIDKFKIYDLAIAVDVASKDRMGYALPIFENAKNTINIDHHITNNNYGTINYNDPSSSSAGEVLYNIFSTLNLEITQDIATCLYTSICTDTGNFKYDNTTAKVLKIAGDLAQFGAKPDSISKAVYGTKPKEMVMLSAFCVNNAIFLENDKIVYSILTTDDMKKLGALNEHSEGIVEILREINTTEIAILFKEIKPEQIKVSMRSKNIDSTTIAKKFNGGGHRFAAGCTVNKPLTIAVEKILEEIKKQF